MFKKIYSVPAVEWVTTILVGKEQKKIAFTGGAYGGSVKAKYITSDPLIQNSIENDPRFNRFIFLENITEIKEQRKEEKIEIKDDFKKYNTVTRVQDAKNILMKDYDVSSLELTNKAKIKAAAAKVKVEFPNL